MNYGFAIFPSCVIYRRVISPPDTRSFFYALGGKLLVCKLYRKSFFFEILTFCGVFGLCWIDLTTSTRANRQRRPSTEESRCGSLLKTKLFIFFKIELSDLMNLSDCFVHPTSLPTVLSVVSVVSSFLLSFFFIELSSAFAIRVAISESCTNSESLKDQLINSKEIHLLTCLGC